VLELHGMDMHGRGVGCPCQGWLTGVPKAITLAAGIRLHESQSRTCLFCVIWARRTAGLWANVFKVPKKILQQYKLEADSTAETHQKTQIPSISPSPSIYVSQHAHSSPSTSYSRQTTHPTPPSPCQSNTH